MRCPLLENKEKGRCGIVAHEERYPPRGVGDDADVGLIHAGAVTRAGVLSTSR